MPIPSAIFLRVNAVGFVLPASILRMEALLLNRKVLIGGRCLQLSFKSYNFNLRFFMRQFVEYPNIFKNQFLIPHQILSANSLPSQNSVA